MIGSGILSSSNDFREVIGGVGHYVVAQGKVVSDAAT